ncbi:MAG: hypothetical protein KDK70_43655, partial [Myxococcales bacterium]|nr:hypothetical protein [Myxococcales bacterium]
MPRTSKLFVSASLISVVLALAACKDEPSAKPELPLEPEPAPAPAPEPEPEPKPTTSAAATAMAE